MRTTVTRAALLAAGLVLVGIGRGAAAQPVDETFAVASMNPLLLLDAPGAVVRLETLDFDVRDAGRATERRRRVVTVLGPNGRDYGRFVVHYNGLRAIKKVRGRLRAADGSVIRKLRKDDQEDYSAIRGYAGFEESRVRVAELRHDVYPYTVEFEVEIERNGLAHYPTWHPQPFAAPVEYAAYDVEAPEDVGVRFWPRGFEGEPEVTEDRGRRRWRWEAADLPAFEPQAWGPAWSTQAPAVVTAPAMFEVEGSRGSLASWADFGRWYADLSAGRDVLPEAVRAEVERRVEGLDDPRDRAARVYALLQETTRYVSVQLGLGGWQTYDAAYVAERGYGDCKALTNYLMAMLHAADVPAFPALIRNGIRAPQIAETFPYNAFNHVVLFAPLAADTLWLEATSQTIPFGHLGASNEDRWALVVRPEGGELVRTPRSRAADNRQLRDAVVRLSADGHAAADQRTRYTGNQQDRIRHALMDRTDRERRDWLHDDVNLPMFEIRSTAFVLPDGATPEMAVDVALDLPRWASASGRRLFVPLALERDRVAIPPAMDERTQPVVFSYPYLDVDTVRYVLPAGFRVEALPAPVHLEHAFARYDATVELDADGVLVYVRRFELRRDDVPAADYDALRSFMQTVSRADQAQVVLVSGT